ncbi:LacI family DNA-binding transcriptional regulator [Filifactor alocis]
MVITIKDVARMAGVSVSTVSRVLNHSKPVSDEIRKRVEKVVEETGYVPNPVARSLVMKKSQCIGVIVSDVSKPRVGGYLNGIEEVARMYDYDLFLCNSYGEVEREIKFIHLLYTKQVAGIIIISPRLTEKVVTLTVELKIPTVFISKNAMDYDVISAGVDDRQASYDITNHFLKQRHTRIGLIQMKLSEDIEKTRMFEGYQNALKEHGIAVDKMIVSQVKNTFEEGYCAMEKLLQLENRPTAVFCCSDDLAVGAMGAVVDNGLSIPKDISIVGYYDTEICSWVRPRMTAVHHPLYDIGASSASLLLKKIENKPIKEKHIQLPYEIIERETSNRLHQGK